MRLDKYLSECGYTRREAVQFISQKKVSINEVIVSKKDYKVNENTDKVCVCNQPINYAKFIYIMMNKPSGVISATNDSAQKTIVDLLPKGYQNKVFPVGRLDKDTTGLILLTNDGEFCHRATSPKHCIHKKYYVELSDEVTREQVKILENGITLKDGYTTMRCMLDMQTKTKGEITIAEGKYHQIKRMFGAVGNKVIALKRLSEGKLKLDNSLKEGEWRMMSMDEVRLVTSKD